MSRSVGRPTLRRLNVIDEEGHRKYVYPADVHGRFNRVKPWLHAALIVFYASVPWIEVAGQPAVLMDIPARRFVLLGNVFNAQDAYLAFSLLTGVGFSLIFATALFGRVWCGWACPQTVFLEGVFRRIERWIEGPHNKRRALAAGPWTLDKVIRRTLKHVAYFTVSWLIAHSFLAYFLSGRELGVMIVEGPAAHPVAFAWGIVPTLLLWGNFWWFREQLCLIVCPYGRLQSALQDYDTVIIGYDKKRGEPRGKAKDPDAGDCVDCGRCVVVCPTGIDIRDGLQMECIGCANCVDACDDIMTKLGRDVGLVRYDSQRGLTEGARRFWRPRLVAYVGAGLVGLGVAVFFFTGRTSFEANMVRPSAVPFVVADGRVTSQVFIHVINKNPIPSRLSISARPTGQTQGVEVTLPQRSVELQTLSDHKLPVLLRAPAADFPGRIDVTLVVQDSASQTEREINVPFLGPRNAK